MTQYQNTLRPKAYSIVISSKRATILHTGIYISLDDAYSAARKELYTINSHKETDGIEIDFWTVLDIPTLLGKLGIKEVEPIKDQAKIVQISSPEKPLMEQIKDAKKQKNVIMKNILIKKDLGLLREAKSLLSKAEVKYLEQELTIKK